MTNEERSGSEPSDIRLAVGVGFVKAGALFIGAFWLKDDHPAGAAVCLCGSLIVAGFVWKWMGD